MSHKFKFTIKEHLELIKVYRENNPHGIADVAIKAIELYKAREARRTKQANPSWNGFFTWTVEMSVHKTWVEGGFDLTNDRAHAMLAHELSHAYGHELKARVISAPDKKVIRKAQGYDDRSRKGKRTKNPNAGLKKELKKRGWAIDVHGRYVSPSNHLIYSFESAIKAEGLEGK
jgi:hypothetical protein